MAEEGQSEKVNLSDIRKEIDEVDGRIKTLFERRMVLADQVARVKAESGDVILKPDREQAIIRRLTQDVDPSIRKEYTALIKRIMEISRKYQYGRTLQLRDALHLDTVSEMPEIRQAAVKKEEAYLVENYAGTDLCFVENDEDLCDAILSGKADAGIGVLENIGVGVSDSLHRILIENPLYINRCRITEDGKYRKKLVLISPRLVVRSSDDRLKIMFVCRNHSGSLASVLSMIADYGVNLTEIHSKPDRNRNWNYIFMVEMAAALSTQEIRALVYQLMNETDQFRILGSYSCEEKI